MLHVLLIGTINYNYEMRVSFTASRGKTPKLYSAYTTYLYALFFVYISSVSRKC